MDTSTLSIMIIFVFTFVPLVIAEIARKSSLPTIENFFLQDRKMPLVMVFFTVYATWVSAFAFFSSTSSFYTDGPIYMTAFAWNILFGVLFMAIGKRIWKYGRLYGYVTPSDFFNDIYQSKGLSIFVTFIMLIFTIPYLQIQLSGGAYLIEIATGGLIPWRVGGLLFYLIIVIYLWSGGIRAVALTDIFYGILIFITMLAIGFYLSSKAGGVEKIFADIMEMDANKNILDSADIFSWLSMFIIVPLGAIMGPPIWLRIYSVGNKRTFDLMPFLISFAAIMYLGSILSGNAGALLIPSLKQTDAVLPTLLIKYGGAIITPLFFCGIASASLSTANSQIHAIAAIYTIDIHRRFINKTATEKKIVDVAKRAVVIISAIAYIFLLLNPGEFIMKTGMLAMSGTAQIAIPTLGALIWKKSNHKAAFWGLASGLITLTILCFITDWDISCCGVVSLLINLAIFLLIGFASKSDPRTREKIVFYQSEYRTKK
ncbi:MAG: sodium:solute symporter family protein [Clostridiales bacterium]|jgi:SSS family solute:Na+ symporter|nr:sodium:solute symporter family protein [Clostridiales bacterium]